MILKVISKTGGVIDPIREFVLERRKSMFTYVVGEDIEFFRLILSFQFIKELKINFLFC